MTLKSKKNNAIENGIIPAHKLEDKHIDAAEEELAYGNSEIRISWLGPGAVRIYQMIFIFKI